MMLGRFRWGHRLTTGHWPYFRYFKGYPWRKKCMECGRTYL